MAADVPRESLFILVRRGKPADLTGAIVDVEPIVAKLPEAKGGPETGRPGAEDSDTIVRVLYYPPVAPGTPPGAVRSAAHEDINLITLLSGATSEGLELLRHDGSWMPVPAV